MASFGRWKIFTITSELGGSVVSIASLCFSRLELMYCKLCHAKENCHCGWWVSKFYIEVGMKLAMSGGLQIIYLWDDGAGIFARDRDKPSGIYFCVY